MSKRAGWGREFDDPIELPDGGELVTLKDAGNYITKLPKAEHEAPEWQAAMEALILVAERGGPTMLPRIGMMRALNAGGAARARGTAGAAEEGGQEISGRQMNRGSPAHCKRVQSSRTSARPMGGGQGQYRGEAMKILAANSCFACFNCRERSRVPNVLNGRRLHNSVHQGDGGGPKGH